MVIKILSSIFSRRREWFRGLYLYNVSVECVEMNGAQKVLIQFRLLDCLNGLRVIKLIIECLLWEFLLFIAWLLDCSLSRSRHPSHTIQHNLTHNKIGIDTHSGVISSLNMFPVKIGLFTHWCPNFKFSFQ